VTAFETPRLTAAEVTEDDISELLEVHLSNQAYLDLTEGSGGSAGAYDRGMLERDLMMSAMTPGRHTCVLRLRDGGACVGVLDWMDENPNDGVPWIGLVMVHGERQRSGLGPRRSAGSPSTGRRTDGRGSVRASSWETIPGCRSRAPSACARSSASPTGSPPETASSP